MAIGMHMLSPIRMNTGIMDNSRLLVAIVIDSNFCHNGYREPQEICESYAGNGEQYVSTK